MRRIGPEQGYVFSASSPRYWQRFQKSLLGRRNSNEGAGNLKERFVLSIYPTMRGTRLVPGTAPRETAMTTTACKPARRREFINESFAIAKNEVPVEMPA